MKSLHCARRPAADQVPVSPLVTELLGILRREDLAYCHWKSNDALARSRTGENDLDLLVGRSDAARFSAVLHRLGFKQALAPAAERLPGVLDYHGYDPYQDRLLHVHLHYQLVIGHDRSKNYRLPVETAYLRGCQEQDGFKVPQPTFEYLLFTIRMVLKYSTWDALLSGQGRAPVAVDNELRYLRPRVDRKLLSVVLTRHLPYLDMALFTACERCLQANVSALNRARTARRLTRRLRAQARRPAAVDVALKQLRRTLRGLRRRLGRLPKKTLLNGGAMIAVVGGDGAGKSTATHALQRWLGAEFATRRVHLGRPPWSSTTYALRGACKGLRLLGRGLRLAAASRWLGAPPGGYTPLIWHWCAARDRYLSYRKARRFVANGGIVICDRFPLPQIKLMDGPQIARLVPAAQRSRFTRWLIAAEQRWYRPFSDPDLLLVLRVDPETAVQRKPEDEADYVRSRNREIWHAEWGAGQARLIDAGQPAQAVLKELKAVVWANL